VTSGGAAMVAILFYSSLSVYERKKKEQTMKFRSWGTGEAAAVISRPPREEAGKGKAASLSSLHQSVCRHRHMLHKFRASSTLQLGPSRQQPRYLWEKGHRRIRMIRIRTV
jgi:hypothetical protein